MALAPDDQRLCVIFGEGRTANDRGDLLHDNPHLSGSLEHDAWAAGWCEAEGPDYVVTARAVRDYSRPTLASIWPR